MIINDLRKRNKTALVKSALSIFNVNKNIHQLTDYWVSYLLRGGNIHEMIETLKRNGNDLEAVISDSDDTNDSILRVEDFISMIKVRS